jgi:hypothetical protein
LPDLSFWEFLKLTGSSQTVSLELDTLWG